MVLLLIQKLVSYATILDEVKQFLLSLKDDLDRFFGETEKFFLKRLKGKRDVWRNVK